METNDTEIQTLEPEVEQTTENHQEETTSEKIKSYDAQRKHWKEKYEAAQKELQTFKKEPQTQINKPNEPDYAKLAYLKSEGVDHKDDMKLVMDEADRLKMPLTDVLQMDHIKTKLEASKQVRVAQTGMPPGTKRSGGYTQHDVEYYLQNPEMRPEDHDLAVKVLNAKIAQEKKDKMFSDQMYTG